MILVHDVPLSRHLHSRPDTTTRAGNVQCRQAAAALHAALKDFATFTLIESHSYVKLVHG
jgi:hypothetical protein